MSVSLLIEIYLPLKFQADTSSNVVVVLYAPNKIKCENQNKGL